MCTNFQTKQTMLTFRAQICRKNGFWGQNFKNLSLDSESASLRYFVYQFSDVRNNFEFWDSNLPKKFWGRNFINQSVDSESGSLRYYVHQFSDIRDYFEFWDSNLPKKFWGRNFKNQSLDSESGRILEILCATIFRQNKQL